MSRPFYTGHDENHFIVRDFLRDVCGGFTDKKFGKYVIYLANFRGDRVAAIDTSALGGFWLDWIVIRAGRGCLVEVKTESAYKSPGHGLKPGEIWAIENIPLKTKIVSTIEQVSELLGEL